MQIDLNDPIHIAGLIAAGFAVLTIILLILVISRAGRSARTAETLAAQMGGLGATVKGLSDGQHQLFGGLTSVSEAQVQAQSRTLELMEARLAQVTEAMNQNLSASARNTAQSLGELQQRLKTIDRAQENITRLSGDVLSLQDILSNKQTRGAFGEIQLHDIVLKALPKDSYTLQATLSNGKRADCLIHLPNPPGPIVIDAKFPLEAYEALRNADTRGQLEQAARDLRAAVRKHIRDIAEKYLIDGETADGALMFLPSEAVYAELHANFPEVVREGFQARVWIVSPTTCMATLNTMRAILKDVRMREQAGMIRKELAMLHKDVERLETRVGNLDRHFTQAQKDVDEIKISAGKAGGRARRLDSFDFDELSQDTPAVPDVAPKRAPRVVRSGD
ncbi:MAG: DNA recombination protein RmuC [Rhodobacterales bacterium]|nr:MAG: DNA recombination protein RmuC [Rhodobacterales bacterium]